MKTKPSGRRARKHGTSRPILRTTPRRARAEATQPAEPKLSESVALVAPAPSAYVRTFERLFRTFRMHLFEQLGYGYGEAIARAEKKICLLSPEFDLQALTDATAPLLVDVVEEIVSSASFFKRQKLRKAAIVLIADLYNKQYNLLEERSAIDRIEQVYYRLKN